MASSSSYVVTQSSVVDFSPATVGEEVVQNVRAIVATQVGTVPMHRDFGTSWEAVDKPIPVARQLLRSAIADAVRKFEPRAQVDGIDWDETEDEAMDGIQMPVVHISVENGDTPVANESSSTASLADVYQRLDEVIGYASDTLALASSVFGEIREIESTVFDSIYSAGFADETGRNVSYPMSLGLYVEATDSWQSVCALIDAVNAAAMRIVADVSTWTLRASRIENVNYKAIFIAGSVEAAPADVVAVSPFSVASVAGTTDADTLLTLASDAWSRMSEARSAVETLRTDVTELTQTSLRHIYMQEA